MGASGIRRGQCSHCRVDSARRVYRLGGKRHGPGASRCAKQLVRTAYCGVAHSIRSSYGSHQRFGDHHRRRWRLRFRDRAQTRPEGRQALTVRAMRSATSEDSVKLDFSHLVAYHIAPVRLSTKTLGTFCGLVSASDPQKVPLQRTYSCWKVHSEKRGKGVQTLLNMAGRGQESRSVLLRNWVEGHIYPFLSQMAKVELEGKFSEIHASSIASEADRSRWASAWARRSLAFCSTVAIASAPAAKRSGGSSWPASRTSASASLAGSPPCWPFMLFHTATVCSVRSA